MDDAFHQEYLEISPNILAAFPKFRPPVGINFFDDSMNRVRPFCAANERLSQKRQEEVAELCRKGKLFLSRQEYREFVVFLSRHLGLLLTEPNLTDTEIAEVFFEALARGLQAFVDQPMEATLDELKKDLAVFCEFLWSDSDRIFTLKYALRKKYNLINHSVNVAFTGVPMYSIMQSSETENQDLMDVTLGFLFHDIGMKHVPESIYDKDRGLFRKEMQSVEGHVAIGVKMLGRFESLDQKVLEAIAHHHERLDGRGYPKGLRGADISLMGRITAVADSFCAMIAKRKWADQKKMKEAVVRLYQDNKRYDKEVVKALLTLVAHE